MKSNLHAKWTAILGIGMLGLGFLSAIPTALASGFDALPIEPSARAWFEGNAQDPATAANTGGDDYELLFTARPRTRGRLRAAARNGDTPLTRIGVCTVDRSVVLRGGAGARAGDRPIPPGYSHFR